MHKIVISKSVIAQFGKLGDRDEPSEDMSFYSSKFIWLYIGCYQAGSFRDIGKLFRSLNQTMRAQAQHVSALPSSRLRLMDGSVLQFKRQVGSVSVGGLI